jgi:hypothetical protein
MCGVMYTVFVIPIPRLMNRNIRLSNQALQLFPPAALETLPYLKAETEKVVLSINEYL